MSDAAPAAAPFARFAPGWVAGRLPDQLGSPEASETGANSGSQKYRSTLFALGRIAIFSGAFVVWLSCCAWLFFQRHP